MKPYYVCSAVVFCLAAFTPRVAGATVECAANLPAGITFSVVPDETLVAGVTSGPTILTVNSDVRFFPNRPPLLKRGSKILANITESKEAGRIHGKARMRITLTSILTSDFCEYPIEARVLEVGRHKVEDDYVWGRGHAQRDTIGFLFPPTTIYQLLRLPSRGPRLTVDNETAVTIKLLQSVSLGQPTISEIERSDSSVKTGAAFQLPSETCPSMTPIPTTQSIVQKTQIVRPLRNLTPYNVSIYLDRAPVLILPPCFGPAMITTPPNEFNLEGTAILPTPGGQKKIGVRIVPNAIGNGWDVVPANAWSNF